MPQQIPIVFRSHPLPVGFNGTPEEIKNAIVARLVAEGTDSIAFFVTGSTEPTSNSGPWLKDGEVWYIWDTVTGSYIPQPLDPASVKIHYGQVAPDPLVYNLWIEYNGSGKSIDIKTYYSGSWRSVFEDKFAQYSTTSQMNSAISSAIAAAISGLPVADIGKASFSAKPTLPQDIVIASASSGVEGDIVLGTDIFDPDSVFASNTFTAPASGYYTFFGQIQAAVSSGTPSDLNIVGKIEASGFGYPIAQLNDEAGPVGTGGRTLVGSCYVYLNGGTTVKLRYDITTNAAVTVQIGVPNTVLSGYRVR